MSSRFNAHSTEPLTKDLYIPDIQFRTSCVTHNAGYDEHCFSVPNVEVEGLVHGAICNARAKKAGFDGRITQMSLFRERPKVTKNGR